MAEQRFLTLTDVSEILNISLSQTRALVKSRELKAIQIGGRNQWRVEISKLDDYIASRYKEAEQVLSADDKSSVEL